MNSLVYLQVLGSCKEFPASREGTGEGFLSGMNSNMIDKLVLGFEGFLLPGTVGPIAGMVCNLRSPDMIDS